MTDLVEIYLKVDDDYLPKRTITISDVNMNNEYYLITLDNINNLITSDWDGGDLTKLNIVGVIFNDFSINATDAFTGCHNLETLIFRGADVILGASCFSGAGTGSDVSGPSGGAYGVTIFYREQHYNTNYDNTAFSGAMLSEFIIGIDVVGNTISVSGYQLTVGETNAKFFDSSYPTGNEDSAAVPVTKGNEPDACFVAGTMINTDQGVIAIEEITTSNTIRGMSICRVTKRLSKNNLVLVKKDAFGVNRPNKNTISTHWHGVYLKDSDKEFVRLINLVDNKKVIEQYYKFEYVYNIELKDKHSYMHANNLKVETLIPGHD